MAAVSESDLQSKYDKLKEEYIKLRAIIADLMHDLYIKDEIHYEKNKEILMLRMEIERLKERNTAVTALASLKD
jgi:ATP:corrinoid adenosyltransferase